MLMDLSGLSNQDLTDLREEQIQKKGTARSDLNLYENDLKTKNRAQKDINERLHILEKVLQRELKTEPVSFSKYKQVKEAIADTIALLDGLRPPLLKLKNDIDAIQTRISDMDDNIRHLDREIKKRGKLIKLEDYDDRFRSTEEDSSRP